MPSGEAIQSYVDEHVNGVPIERLRTPFVATATRVSDGKLVLFNTGDTGLAVRASSASPGQFEPVTIGNDSYVDGDEASPVPIHAARDAGRPGRDRRGRVRVRAEHAAGRAGRMGGERREARAPGRAGGARGRRHDPSRHRLLRGRERGLPAQGDRDRRARGTGQDPGDPRGARARAALRRRGARRSCGFPRAKPPGSRRARTTRAAPSARVRVRPPCSDGVPAGACGRGS